ncbi:tRNA isopentenyl-2-thiomethyl-A-37 hydroxylase MiaE [Alteromonas sp. C1M14]|uniref:tRNA isopentenyl-2-thiomethyl-A-37 hydroxylase MiaE n=1 Tax=Alteromonas sp. C1M14 TaxID=2841567 RepID=UPI001C09257B|nr:tRNA isopentenyl-2-thiomethyl-A-37 hydroxylase MiaE [Alteromonas sp. C1M14]
MESLQYASLLAPINAFIHCSTPDAWTQKAAQKENLPVLLIDHCNCELKDNMCTL